MNRSICRRTTRWPPTGATRRATGATLEAAACLTLAAVCLLTATGGPAAARQAGPAGNGAAAACKSSGVLFIGVDADQYRTIAGIGDTIVTSAVKRVDTAVFLAVQDAAAGRLQGGVTRIFGLAEGGVGLAPYHARDKKLPRDIKTDVARAKAAVIAGDVTVPETMSASSRARR